MRGMKYRLAIPNKEVRISLMGSIADFMSKISNSELTQEYIYDSLIEADFKSLEIHLKSLFASIPYNLFTNNKMYKYEGYYVSIFYSYMKALGIEIVGEDVTNKGRIDLTIKLPNLIIIVEFKVDETSALEQIKEKKYYEKYLDKNLPIYLVGIEFNTKERNLSGLEYEKL